MDGDEPRLVLPKRISRDAVDPHLQEMSAGARRRVGKRERGGGPGGAEREPGARALDAVLEEPYGPLRRRTIPLADPNRNRRGPSGHRLGRGLDPGETDRRRILARAGPECVRGHRATEGAVGILAAIDGPVAQHEERRHRVGVVPLQRGADRVAERRFPSVDARRRGRHAAARERAELRPEGRHPDVVSPAERRGDRGRGAVGRLPARPAARGVAHGHAPRVVDEHEEAVPRFSSDRNRKHGGEGGDQEAGEGRQPRREEDAALPGSERLVAREIGPRGHGDRSSDQEQRDPVRR